MTKYGKDEIGNTMNRYSLSKVSTVSGNRRPLIIDQVENTITIDFKKLRMDTFYMAVHEGGIFYGTHRTDDETAYFPLYILMPNTINFKKIRKTAIAHMIPIMKSSLGLEHAERSKP